MALVLQQRVGCLGRCVAPLLCSQEDGECGLLLPAPVLGRVRGLQALVESWVLGPLHSSALRPHVREAASLGESRRERRRPERSSNLPGTLVPRLRLRGRWGKTSHLVGLPTPARDASALWPRWMLCVK